MSHWWRAHDEAVDDPKLGLLSDRLHRCWFNLNCLASANGGTLPPIGVIAFKLRISKHKAAEIITTLVNAKLVDKRDDGLFEPHNWASRQFKSDVTDPTNATRQKRYRDRHAVTANTVTETVTVTPPREQSTETEAETDKENSSLRSPRAKPNGDETEKEFEEFYQVFPRHEGRGHALKAYRGARKIVDSTKLLEGATRARERYRDSDPKFIPLPATWLHGQRWLDEAAPAASAKSADHKAKMAEYDKFYRGVL